MSGFELPPRNCGLSCHTLRELAELQAAAVHVEPFRTPESSRVNMHSVVGLACKPHTRGSISHTDMKLAVQATDRFDRPILPADLLPGQAKCPEGISCRLWGSDSDLHTVTHERSVSGLLHGPPTGERCLRYQSVEKSMRACSERLGFANPRPDCTRGRMRG